MNTEEDVIQPDYLKEFKCAESRCRENCCFKWTVCIDKNTYNKYENIQNEKIRKKILRKLQINKNCKYEDADYAFIKFDFDYACPFLDKNKKCRIHSELGAEYLGAVCNMYPRYINKIDSTYEMSLDCSCIEAAELILGKEEKITFEKNRKKIKENIFINKEIDTKICGACFENKKYVKEIRSKSIEIMQNRTYNMSERFYMLGKFLNDVRNFICYNYENVPKDIHLYNINSYAGEFKRNADNYKRQIKFYKEMTKKMGVLNLFSQCSSSYFKKNIKNVIKIFNNEEKAADAYIECEKYIFSEYSSIFENYIVNEIFRGLFPFSYNNIMYNDYVMLIFKYGFLKFYITGRYLYKGSISKEDIIWSIQSFHKKVVHDDDFLNFVRRYFIENQMDNLDSASILL